MTKPPISDDDLKRLMLMSIPGDIRALGKSDVRRLLVKLQDIERLITRYELLIKRFAHHLSPAEKLVWRRELQHSRMVMRALAQFCRKNQELQGDE